MRKIKLIIASILLLFSNSAAIGQGNYVAEMVKNAFLNKNTAKTSKDKPLTTLLTQDNTFASVQKQSGIKYAKYFDFDTQKARNLISEKSQTLSMNVTDANGRELVLDLVNTDEVFDGLIISTSSGKSFDFKKITAVFYTGVVRGEEQNSLVNISVFTNEIKGLISYSKGNLVLGKIENSSKHIIYNDVNLEKKNDFNCESLEAPFSEKTKKTATTEKHNGVTNKCVRLYYETEYDIFTNKGSVANVVAYITTLHNQMSGIYMNEGIKTVISEIKVWDTVDPYVGTNTLAVLNEFGAIRTVMNGDIGQLVTFRPLGGGIAYVNTLCFPTVKYKQGVSALNPSFENAPVYSWSVEVLTHEFGHLLGSLHTQDCAWNGNNTPIDGCYPNGGNCGTAPIPDSSVGGTIMSYCHLTRVGINFANGFGIQPGDVIRNNVNKSSCLQTCSSCVINLDINQPLVVSKLHQVSNQISASSTINQNLTTNLRANSIVLKPGFSVTSGVSGLFMAVVDPCSNTTTSSLEEFEGIPEVLESSSSLHEKFAIINPNPNKGIFKIALNKKSDGAVLITNMIGQTVYANNFNAQTELEVNIQNEASGVYVVNVTIGGQQYIEKIIKQ